MLVELHIENLGVIERATLELGPGVIALTGETGAGKTMLVEAIGLIVGGRADAAVVRAGASEARIDGRFEIPGESGPDELVLTRVIPADGRSRAYVNGRPATAGNLSELARGLVDLHGQHAHQSLLTTATQRAALDRFGSIDLRELRDARAHLTEIDAELAALGGDERARAREIDLLAYQVDELNAAVVDDPDEDERLAAEESLLADAGAHREALEAAANALHADDAATDQVAIALRALEGRTPFGDLAERLRAVIAELDDLSAELRDRSADVDEDPERLDTIRIRRQLLVDLRRKYGTDLAEVMSFHAEAEDRLNELRDYDRRAAALDSKRQDALAAESDAAGRVGAARRSAAPLLAGQVEQRLRELAMPNAAVSVDVGGVDSGGPGDDVAFMLAANPGSPPLPLAKTASGGELARAMLALRLVLADTDDPADGAPTLVFDEVDAGIGGTAASAVAAALAALGDRYQVLIVTHLPQVAAVASRQLVVDKQVHDDVTTTSVGEVTGEPRTREIARMLSGTDSAAALDHARDLLT